MIIQIPALDKWKLGTGTKLTALPDGTSAIGALGSTFSANLEVTPQQVQADPSHPQPGYALDGVYQFSFSVANYFPAYPGQYDLVISYGTQQLGECYGWGTAAFSTVTVDFPNPHYLLIYHSLPGGGTPQGQNDLIISGSESGGWPLMFKDFSLTFTPEN